MKCRVLRFRLDVSTSPSMRREWIEMFQGHELDKEHLGLPPCGGSGLKYVDHLHGWFMALSPSMRREWIEMNVISIVEYFGLVSLHAEGVD